LVIHLNYFSVTSDVYVSSGVVSLVNTLGWRGNVPRKGKTRSRHRILAENLHATGPTCMLDKNIKIRFLWDKWQDRLR